MNDYSVFLDNSVGLVRVVALLSRQLTSEPNDVSTHRLQGRGFEWVSMGLRYYVKDQPGYDDDCGIPLSSYGIEVGIYPATEAKAFDQIETLLEVSARFVAWTLSNELGLQATVVRNLQHILVQYGK